MLSGRHSLSARAIRSAEWRDWAVRSEIKTGQTILFSFRNLSLGDVLREKDKSAIVHMLQSELENLSALHVQFETGVVDADNLAFTQSRTVRTFTSEIRPASTLRSSKHRKLKPFSSPLGNPIS